MKSIEVAYFAIFREQAGCATQTVTTKARDAAGLFAEMCATHPQLAALPAMKFAVNDELCGAERVLRDGDRVLFFPPMAGG